MGRKPALSLITQPQEFFYSLVVEALGKRQIKPQPETEFYLVNLLNEFVSADRLYVRDQEGHPREEPLALLLKGAIDEQEPFAKRLLFRQLGDVSLYTAGYFQESILRHAVGIDYYVEVGSTAYQNVAKIDEKDSRREMFLELGERFPLFVEVLAEVSEKTATEPRTESELLRLYSHWASTGSERTGKTLRKAGIQALRKPKKSDPH